MKNVKRLLCLGAALVMVLSIAMMTSCNKPIIYPNDHRYDFPIPDAITLTWWYDYGDQYFTGDFTKLEDHPYMVERKNDSNVTIEFVEPTNAGQAKNELTALMASNDMCDMVTHAWYTPDIQGTTIDSVIDEEIYLRLNEYVDVQMENYRAMCEQYSIIDKIALTQQNNRIWIPKINHMEDYDKEKLTNGLVVRKDYLDAVQFVSEDGVSHFPVTMRDWENMLEDFLAYGIERPLSKNMSPWITFTGDVFLTSWNVKVETYRDPATGNAAYGCVTDEFKAYVETMRKWVENGWLVSVDSNEQDKLSDKVVASWYGNADEIINLKAQATDANFELIGVPDPVQNVGDKIVMRDSYRPVGCKALDSVFVSATCLNPAIACRWLDEFFTEESYMRTSYGIEGVDYNKDAEGNITFTEKITNNPDGIRHGIAQNAFLDSFYCDPYVIFNYAYTPEQLAAVEQWSKSSCEFSFIDRLCLSYTEEELAVLEVTEGLGWQVALQSSGFVLGSKDLTEWPTYVAQMEESGLQEYIGVMQSAWDRFLAS